MILIVFVAPIVFVVLTIVSAARESWPLTTVFGCLTLVSASAFFSAINPNLDVPVVSQIVCGMKGDSWYPGGIYGGVGCYVPSSFGQSPQAPPEVPQTASQQTGNLPAGVTPGPRPGTYYVDCFTAQCTTLPNAGPFGTTCGAISTGEQLCQ